MRPIPFTHSRLDPHADLTLPRLQLALQAIRDRDYAGADALLNAVETEHVFAHDGLRDVNARTLDEIHRRYGQDFADPFCSSVYEETTVWYVKKAPEPATFRAAAEAVAMLWHWHMTTFRLREDREKLTFILEPCGSGGRLINDGSYYATRKDSLSLIPNASYATFGESDFPSYCTHCADHNRTFLRRGFNIMVFEGWTRAHRYGACISHVFKRLDSLPDDFYRRIGVDRSEIPNTKYIPEFAERVFTDDELHILELHPVIRVHDALMGGDTDTATALLEASWGSWMGLHGAYRVWYTAFCNHMHDLGAEARESLMNECAWRLVEHALVVTASGVREPLEVWSQFWRSHGEPVALSETSSGYVFEIAAAALIDPGLSKSWSDADFIELCRAIMYGVRGRGQENAFGTLEYRDQRLHHYVARA